MKKNIFKYSLLSLLIAGVYSTSAFASIVSDQIPYQTYLDFARNRGEFVPNAVGEKIFNKKGENIATLTTPMPDFSSVDIYLRVATLINPQYVVSVAHNVGYRSVTFGDKNNSYQLVNTNTCNRNQKVTLCRDDVHIPRLDKLVTDVAPTPIFDSDVGYKELLTGNRYTEFYRTGTGIQKTYNPLNKQVTNVTGGYIIAIGGIIPTSELSINKNVKTQYLNGEHLLTFRTKNNNFIPSQNNPLPTIAQPGDSGSPIFVYDNQEKQWKVITVLHAISGNVTRTANTYSTFIPVWLTKKIFNLDNISINTDKTQNYTITKESTKDDATYLFKNTSTTETNKISQTFTGAAHQHNFKWPDYAHDKNYINYDLDNGKNLILSGGGNINLASSVDQGAGSLTFNDNYTISSNNNSTWVGAGLNIAANKTVIWKVNGLDDTVVSYQTKNKKGKTSTHRYNRNNGLYKIGKGTLIINAVGNNPGKMRIGDGLVILNQQPDNKNQIQAASQLWIVSGRPTVQLANNKQINPDNIYWGYRGGLLDTNGNDLNFTTLNAADIGANLGNNNLNRISSITLTPNYTEYTITNKDKTKTTPPLIYHGQLTGNINFNLNLNGNNTYVFDGGIGSQNNAIPFFNQNNGITIFQGHPVIHAYISGKLYNKLKPIVPSIQNTPTSATQNDWENRYFYIKNMTINNGTLTVGRNAHLIVSQNLTLNHSTFNLNNSNVYTDPEDGNGIFNTHGGVTATVTPITTKTPLKQEDMPTFSGDINAINSNLNFSNANINSNFTNISGGNVDIENNSQVNFGTASINSNFKAKNSLITFKSGSKINGVITLHNTTLNLNSTEFNGYFKQSDDTPQTINNSPLKNHLLPILSLFATNISPETTAEINNAGENNTGTNNTEVNNTTENSSDIIANNSHITLTNDSNIDNLKLSGNSSLTFANDNSQRGHTLTVKNFDANQQNFQFNVYNENNSDKLTVTKKSVGTNNKIVLKVKDSQLFRKTFQHKLDLIELPANSKNPFSTIEINDGITSYTPELIETNDNNKIGISLDGFKINYSPIFSDNLSQLLLAQNDIIINASNSNNLFFDNPELLNQKIWVNTKLSTGKIGSLKINNKNITIGINKKLNNTVLGFSVEYNKTQSQIENLSGTTNMADLRLYYHYNNNDGFFTNFDTQYAKLNQNYSLSPLGIQQAKPKIRFILTDTTIGYNYPLLSKLSLQPNIQFSAGYLGGYKISNGNLTANVNHSIPLIGKIGLQISEKNITNKFSFGLYYEQDYNSGGDIDFTDFNYLKNYSAFKDKHWLMNLVLSQNLTSHSHIYLETSHNFAGKLNDNTVLFGINYNF